MNVGRKREDTKCIQKYSAKIYLEMPTRKNTGMGGQHYDGSYGQPPHYNNQAKEAVCQGIIVVFPERETDFSVLQIVQISCRDYPYS